MTDAFPEHPPLRRGRPWSSRTSRGADIVVAVFLFIGEAAVYMGMTFTYGLEGWAAQGGPAGLDAARLADIAWMEGFLCVLLAFAALALLSRAPWTVVSQLVVAGIVAVLLVSAQHDYDRAHPAPAPTPRAGYSPCYSGSGTCD
ncbi:DUF6234 family protein [Streptomyces xylophagus]|uniref:DUF6234 family protein n=1 Tax=Streptomyces xylophagus TaxID=285514 RepID=UPI0005BD85A2|nr:DUF6234 family protein [Streptomyces xylophagus]